MIYQHIYIINCITRQTVYQIPRTTLFQQQKIINLNNFITSSYYNNIFQEIVQLMYLYRLKWDLKLWENMLTFPYLALLLRILFGNWKVVHLWSGCNSGLYLVVAWLIWNKVSIFSSCCVLPFNLKHIASFLFNLQSLHHQHTTVNLIASHLFHSQVID